MTWRVATFAKWFPVTSASTEAGTSTYNLKLILKAHSSFNNPERQRNSTVRSRLGYKKEKKKNLRRKAMRRKTKRQRENERKISF